MMCSPDSCPASAAASTVPPTCFCLLFLLLKEDKQISELYSSITAREEEIEKKKKHQLHSHRSIRAELLPDSALCLERPPDSLMDCRANSSLLLELASHSSFFREGMRDCFCGGAFLSFFFRLV